MKTSGGRKSTAELTILRNMVWGNSLVAANKGSTSKLVFLFPQTSSGSDSTMFHKVLDHGRPSPAFFSEDGGLGPALQAEKEYPGTLRWLLHTFWSVLAAADLPFLRVVYQTMAILQITHSEPLLIIDEGEGVRSTLPLADQLQSLKEDGSLDALTAVILLAQEAYCLCRPKSHKEVFDFSTKFLLEWKCISWMPVELKSALVQCILHKIRRCAPAPLELELATVESFQQSILTLGKVKNEFNIGSFAVALHKFESSVAREEFPESQSFGLSDAAKATLCKRILPWLEAGAP